MLNDNKPFTSDKLEVFSRKFYYYLFFFCHHFHDKFYYYHSDLPFTSTP